MRCLHRPGDETLEAFHGLGRRGDEAGDFLGHQEGVERCRVGRTQLTQQHLFSHKHGKGATPIGGDSIRGRRLKNARANPCLAYLQLRVRRHLLHDLEAPALNCRQSVGWYVWRGSG